MKKSLIITMAGLLVLGVTSIAKATVIFDFDSLSDTADTAIIETYMEGLYGSDITASNVSITNNGPLGSGTDRVMEDSSGSNATHWFEISFNQVPITSVSFDWGTYKDAFHALADGEEFFTASGSGYNSGNTSMNFTSPVTVLRFTDGGYGSIQIDNLQVTPVPEPSTLLFLGTGLVGLAGFLRGKKTV